MSRFGTRRFTDSMREGVLFGTRRLITFHAAYCSLVLTELLELVPPISIQPLPFSKNPLPEIVDIADKNWATRSYGAVSRSTVIHVLRVCATSHSKASFDPQFSRQVMGKARIVEWSSLSGKKLRGVLVLPAGYVEGKRLKA